jgi:histidine triad (HIT) family protein
MTSCPFCERIVAGQFDPLTADSYVVTFEPLNPVAKGHVLVVSRSHITDATADPFTAGMAMQKAANLARNMVEANIITSIGAAATQTVNHFHLHVVPRSAGDGLALPWTGQHG